jgi:hypothetical protein
MSKSEVTELHFKYVFAAVTRRPSFLMFTFFIISSFLLPRRSIIFRAGDITQFNLPVGIQVVNFNKCIGLTGKYCRLRG